MKLFLILLCLIMPIFCFADTTVDIKKIVGKWSCTASFTVNKLEIVELSDVIFSLDGDVSQKGTAYYKEYLDEAILKYDVTSRWSSAGNLLKYKKLKVNQHSINNQSFDDRHQISSSLLDSVNNEDIYTILTLTDNVLITIPKGYSFKEVCRKSLF